MTGKVQNEPGTSCHATEEGNTRNINEDIAKGHSYTGWTPTYQTGDKINIKINNGDNIK